MATAPAPPAGPARQSRVDALLDSERPFDGRRLRVGERRAEAVLAVLTAVSAGLLLTLGPPLGWRALAWLGAGGILYAACARVRVYVGGGYATPTQAVLVALLLALPAWDVPAVVTIALAATTVIEIAGGEERAERMLTRVSDAAHALAPSVVVVLSGATTGHVGLPTLTAAIAAQFLVDGGLSMGREWLGRAIPPAQTLEVMWVVFAIDLLLTPVGVAAEARGVPQALGIVMIASVVALLAGLSHDRTQRLRDARERYDLLERERENTRRAIQVIGCSTEVGLTALAIARSALEATVRAVDACGGRIEVAVAANGSMTTASIGDLQEHPGTGCRISVPLRRPGDTRAPLGTILIERDRPFIAHEQELVEHFAAHAAMSLENCSQYERIRVQATHDRLTGLVNRAVFDEALERESARVARTGRPLGLVLLDIDHFKSFNDTYGHQVGDMVLRAVAQAVRSQARASDVVARYGGEELAVLLPDTDSADVARLAERIRRAVAATAIDQDGASLKVTASLGIADAEPFVAEPARLLAAADGALYSAKRAGRNRCETAAPAGIAATALTR